MNCLIRFAWLSSQVLCQKLFTKLAYHFQKLITLTKVLLA